MLKILLADDHALLREGLRKSFESAGDDVVGEASSGEEAVALAKALQPQVVLMDLSMPVMDGIEATRRIREEVPGVRVAVLTMHDDIDKTRDAIAAGASAYLSKGTSFADVRETVHRVADGMSTKQAGRYLGITTKTVQNHLNAIYRKLDAQSLTHAVLGAVRLGIIDLNSEVSETI